MAIINAVALTRLARAALPEEPDDESSLQARAHTHTAADTDTDARSLELRDSTAPTSGPADASKVNSLIFKQWHANGGHTSAGGGLVAVVAAAAADLISVRP